MMKIAASPGPENQPDPEKVMFGVKPA